MKLYLYLILTSIIAITTVASVHSVPLVEEAETPPPEKR